MLKALVLLFALLGVLYFLFYPWLRNSIGRKKFFKWFLILYGAVAVASTLGKVLLD
jgi:quinol-cytochrome oxidoreductase complex cytochrome b subunit